MEMPRFVERVSPVVDYQEVMHIRTQIAQLVRESYLACVLCEISQIQPRFSQPPDTFSQYCLTNMINVLFYLLLLCTNS